MKATKTIKRTATKATTTIMRVVAAVSVELLLMFPPPLLLLFEFVAVGVAEVTEGEAVGVVGEDEEGVVGGAVVGN